MTIMLLCRTAPWHQRLACEPASWSSSLLIGCCERFRLPRHRHSSPTRSTARGLPPTTKAQRQQRPLLLAGARRAPLNLPLFESQRWFTGFSGERDPAVERVLLAAAPANPVPAELSRREWVRHLAMDPVYQLK